MATESAVNGMTHMGKHCVCIGIGRSELKRPGYFALPLKGRVIAAGFLTLGFSFALSAETYQFPSGGGDLADLAKWKESYPSLTDLPGSADGVKLGSSSVFTMLADMDVGSFSFNSKNATLDFASSGNHTLKVMNSQHAFCADNGTIKGGTIDRNGQDFYWFQSSGKEMTVTDGCILTNANAFLVNVWGHSGGKLHLTGSSRIHSKSLTVNKGAAGTTSGNSFLDVTGGSKVFTTAEWNYSEYGANDISSGGNVLSVSGAGSAVTMAGNYLNGYDCNGNTLCIADGGIFSSKSLHVGWATSPHYSNSNRLAVVGGTLGVTGGSLNCYGDGNVISVTNGTVDIANKAYSYDGSASSNTKIDIVDSTWKCANFNVGKSVALLISGASTVFETSEKFFGLNNSNSTDAKITLDDGFLWRPNIGYGYYFMEKSTNCILIVKDNATFSAWHPSNNDYDRIILCGSSSVNMGVSNVISVLNDGRICGKTIELNGLDNFVVISNGVLNASDSILLGAVNGTSNNTVIVQGNAPRLSADGIFYLRFHTALRIEVPDGGYPSGYVPITAKGFSMQADTCRFEIDVSRFLPKEKTTLTLISFEDSLTDEQKNFLLAAELPPRYSLEIVGNSNLVLKAKGEPKGFMMTLR